LQEVSRPELEIKALEQLVKAEASVCYRLLRYLNSAMFGFQSEIHSVRHALSILGERDVRRWVRLVAAVGAGQEKTSDLVLSALVRVRFGELLSPRVAHGESDLFLLGLLSLIDAMLEIPIEDVLERIPLDHETKAVLLGQPSLLSGVPTDAGARERGVGSGGGVEREIAPGFRGCGGFVLAGAGVGSASFQRGVNAAPASDPCLRREQKPCSHGLLCKSGRRWALRGFARTSNIKLFSFRPRSRAGLPRQPIRGGALTDPIKTENRFEVKE
jgi:hypothetical protein